MNNQIQLVLKSSTTELSLNDHELGIYLVPELDGLTGLPEIRTTSGVNSGYDGGWTSAQHYDARSITIRGVIANTDVATVERLRKQLVSLAGQGKQEELTLDLVTEAGNAYTLQVRTIALEMAMKGVLEKQEFMLQLRADDPLIYDNAESTHEAYIQVSKATGGFTINFDLPLAITGGSEETVISNDGLEQVPTITRLYGELHNPKIINQTTNQSMQINADLGFSEGQWVDASEVVTGKTINIEDAPDNAPLASFRLDGETSQNGTPTPSTPVAVQAVTGENVVKICGKNLFDKTNSNLLLSNVYIGSSSLGTANGAYTAFIECSPNTTYTISKTAGARFICGTTTTLPSTGVAIANRTADNTASSITLTTSSTAKYLVVFYFLSSADSGTQQAMLDSLQFESGSTATTTYEPYQGQSYEVNLGKNLLNSGGVVQITGQIQPDKTLNTSSGSTVYMLCQPNTTYVFSKTNTSRTRLGTAANLLDSSHNLTNYVAGTSTTSGGRYYGVITSGPQDKYIYLTYSEYSDTTVETVQGQLEIGNEPSDYDSSAPIELCKIGTYQDYIYKSGGKWYVHKETASCPLNSTNASFFQLTAATGYADLRMSKPSIGMIEGWWSGLMLATNFSPKLPNANMQPGQFNVVVSANNVSFALPTTITTLQDAKDYMDGLVGSKIYYVLATPTDTEITNEALIAQLETLLNTARTYAGVNNIFTVTPNEQGTLEISYYTHKTADNRDEIVIDSRLRTVTLNGLDIYHLIETGSEFLMLAPGENKLSLQSDITGDNGYAEVSYKQGYLSI